MRDDLRDPRFTHSHDSVESNILIDRNARNEVPHTFRKRARRRHALQRRPGCAGGVASVAEHLRQQTADTTFGHIDRNRVSVASVA